MNEVENKEYNEILKKGEIRIYNVEFYDDDMDEFELGNTLTWAFYPEAVVEKLYNIYGEYRCYRGIEAKIKAEDIFAVYLDIIRNGWVILNPDKLYDVKYFNSIADICDEEELPDYQEDSSEED